MGLTISCEPGLGSMIFISDDLAVTISVDPMPLGKNIWQPSVLSTETVGTFSLTYRKLKMVNLVSMPGGEN